MLSPYLHLHLPYFPVSLPHCPTARPTTVDLNVLFCFMHSILGEEDYSLQKWDTIILQLV